ncbi:hypothetical protein cyc_07386, partial [Cyclospora cayetanensis]
MRVADSPSRGASDGGKRHKRDGAAASPEASNGAEAAATESISKRMRRRDSEGSDGVQEDREREGGVRGGPPPTGSTQPIHSGKSFRSGGGATEEGELR